jgi:rubrerythrin
MSKRREEEQKIIAEMEQALKEQGIETPTQKRERKSEKTAQPPKKKRRGMFGGQDDITPQTVHCKRCKTLMENGVCPTCGYKIYMPMDEEKRKKIRTVVSVVCVAAFVVLFLILQLKK